VDRIGVFVCHCGINISATVDVQKVVEEIRDYPGVIHVEDYIYMCSDPGQNLIKERIKEKNLSGVIVAACSPTLHETTFRRTVASAGLNPYLFENANIREQCSWVHENRQWATQKALRIIKTTVEKLRLDEALIPIKTPITRRALVIGGGIAGIQASLDIADAGYETILVEREPSIGGHMAQLSETFPTLDCSQCILTPKMVDVGHHEKIRLYTYSEVEEVSGYVGNFKVKIRKKAPFVDWDKCTGCDDCTEPCPVDIRSQFDVGLIPRKAIYRPFPQAIPNKFTISKFGLPPCRLACPAGVNVPGYINLIKLGKYKEALALEREANPFPAVCGRVCTHPCEGECARGQVDEPLSIRALKRFIADKETERETPQLPPQKESKVAIIGAGPSGLSCASELAKKGYRTTVFEALPVAGGMMRVGIPAFRLPREELQRDIDYIKGWGVEIRTNTPVQDPEGLRREGWNAVYIATGAPIERKLGVEGEDLAGVHYGIEFLRRINLGEKVEVGARVAIIGGGNSAVDAARTALRLGAKKVTIIYRRSRVEMPAIEEEIERAEKEGVKIEYLANPKRIIGEGGKVSKMECIRMKLGAPDASGRRSPHPIQGSEFTIGIDTVIPTIGQTPDASYLPKGTNLRLTEGWNSLVVEEGTLQTTVPGIFAGGDAVTGPATVIEAIAQGKRAAVSIDRYIQGVDLQEGRGKVVKKVDPRSIWTKGIPQQKREEGRFLEVSESLKGFAEVELGLTEEQAKKEAERCLNCGGCAECLECVQACKAEAINHGQEDEILEEEVGAIVVATGYELYPVEKMTEYGGGEYKDVINGLQFERLLSASGPTQGEVKRPSDGQVPKRVAFVACSGSRDPKHHLPYCSKICCMYTAKHALLYKHHVPDGEAVVFYIDTRAAGKDYEEFLMRAREEGKVLYIRGKPSRILKDGDDLVVWSVNTLTGEEIQVKVDLVVLSMAIVPSSGVVELARKLKIQTNPYGFLSEAHPKLRPVESLVPGIFFAGCAQAQKDIPDSVTQGSAAASKVLDIFSQEELQHEPIVTTVDEDICSGCELCISVCPYGAREIRVKGGKRVATVNEALCEGCGACVAVCPSGAAQQRNLNDLQLSKMVEAAF